jgi:hypothetical protein
MSAGFNSVENSCNPIVIRRALLQHFSGQVVKPGSYLQQIARANDGCNFHLLKLPKRLNICSAAKFMAYSGYGRISVPSGIRHPA